MHIANVRDAFQGVIARPLVKLLIKMAEQEVLSLKIIR